MKEYNIYTDDQLVNLFQSGEAEAFDELLKRYDSDIHTLIRMYIKDVDMVEDIFQEVFIRAMNSIRGNHYKSEGYFRAWLVRITRNLLVDYHRRATSENKALPMDASPELLDIEMRSRDNLLDEKPNAEESLIAQEQRDILHQYLSKLPAQQREVVFLHYWKDYTFREIAEMTGVSINTSLGRMRYALKTLKKIYKDNINLDLD